ncbi:hypothetical protein LSM04_007678 [Trypanosoma melophagium]|uniref:uncharacterized protein n=1 Tax=Trypanosoma melophagium TaxID=715481 RepID=UPI003519EABC|nr:hypothetical protein LSM04_006127 [Trypanosoma melophagium]KAH9577852.1 hypothetical protein LSM04_007678 [Trypanosoma melophagium]
MEVTTLCGAANDDRLLSGRSETAAHVTHCTTSRPSRVDVAAPERAPTGPCKGDLVTAESARRSPSSAIDRPLRERSTDAVSWERERSRTMV